MAEQICLSLIQNMRPRMTEVEKKAADYILGNSEKVLYMTASQLAKEAGVAASGVIRLCKTLGYSGFSELKISLARRPEPVENHLLPAVGPDDDTAAIFEKVFASSIKTLRDTLAMMDRSTIDRAVTLLHDADRIEFYGIGTSSTIAEDAYFRIMRIGYPAYCATDGSIMRISASTLDHRCVAVGISHSGRTIETTEALRIARSHGASTIVITSHKDSPITRQADVVLNVFSDEARYPTEAVSARIAHIALLDALCVTLSVREYDRTARCMEFMNDYFRQIRLK